MAVDVNEKQIDGSTDDVLAMGSIGAKFEAFDWEVIHVTQGNNLQAIDADLLKQKANLAMVSRSACYYKLRWVTVLIL